MENSSITTNSTISQNNFKETTAILRFEVPLKRGQGNNVIYFPDLINPPKETTNDQKIISMDDSLSDQQHLENEMALENFVVSETADFLEHMAIEKRPEPKFYAISGKNTTPGFFGAGTNINPPENILQFFKNEQLNNNNNSTTIASNITETTENNENKIVNKQIKPRARKNATTASKSKGKKIIKQEEKLTPTNEISSSTSSSKKTKRQPSQQSETKTKKQKTKANEGNKTIIKKVQRLLEKRKRRKEKKINKDVSTGSIASSSSSKNSTPITKSLKPARNVEDDSSLSSTSSTESSPNRKDRPDVRSRSSSTSSTVTSTKANKKPKSQANNSNNYNAESSTITSDSATTP
jgi:hypothetical protein